LVTLGYGAGGILPLLAKEARPFGFAQGRLGGILVHGGAGELISFCIQREVLIPSKRVGGANSHVYKKREGGQPPTIDIAPRVA